jgi:hypothetical protein
MPEHVHLLIGEPVKRRGFRRDARAQALRSRPGAGEACAISGLKQAWGHPFLVVD